MTLFEPQFLHLEDIIFSKIPLLFFWKIVRTWSKPFWSLEGGWISFQDEFQSGSINKRSGTKLKEVRNKLTQRFNPRKAERFDGLLNLKTFWKMKWEIICIYLILLMLEKAHTFVHSLVSEDSYTERTLIHNEFLFQIGIAYNITNLDWLHQPDWVEFSFYKPAMKAKWNDGLKVTSVTRATESRYKTQHNVSSSKTLK